MDTNRTMSLGTKSFGVKESPPSDVADEESIKWCAVSDSQPPSIHDAARKGDLERVKSLLKDHPDWVLSKDKLDRTPLHGAATQGQREVVEWLLVNRAEVNAKDNNGSTALHLAARKGDQAVATLLLTNKAEVNAKDNNGSTPLHGAVSNGHKEVAELLLDHKAEVNAKDKSDWTPLHYAAQGCKEVAELLMAHGAEVNAKNSLGATPLHLAAEEGYKDVAELQRQHGGHE